MTAPVVSIRALRKEYAGVVAVDGASFDLLAGEIVGLVGKNGAGKSTVIKVLAGAVAPDEGELRVDGEIVAIGTPHKAHELGFAFMHQELEQVPRMSVAENVMLGTRLPRRFGWLLSWPGLYEQAGALLRELDADIDPRAPIDALSVAQQRLVMVARALHLEARVLVLDEPTTSLTDREVRQLHAICRRLRERGTTVVYVSHRLSEILDLSDRVVVMRDGRVVQESETATLRHDALVEAIAGTGGVTEISVERRRAAVPSSDAETLLALRDLAREGTVAPTSFELRRGEILGIAGLVGAGRTELMRLIFGADRATSGSVEVRGERVALRTPSDAMTAGIALLPEDRRHQGMILDFGVRQNVTLASLRRFGSRVPFFPSRARERDVTDELVARLRVVAADREQPVRYLSGGNQQKVVLAKWLARDADVLIFDEPTAGIDVGAKDQLYRILEDLATDGKGVLFVSSEFAELVAVCHRVLVMSEGRIVGELQGDDISDERIVAMCYHGSTG